jgi:hypothetical protein
MTQLYIFGKTWHNSLNLAKTMTQLYIFDKTSHISIILAKTRHKSLNLAKL